nr:Smr/MutS family protein [uncultured Holophaga sp.]
MAWKQSLAKLKQDLKAAEGDAPRAAAPKAVPKKVEPVAKPIEEEDDLFLSAMGVNRRGRGLKPPMQEAPVVKTESGALRAQPKDVGETPLSVPAQELPATGDDFGQAMAGLKGMKALARPLPGTAPTPGSKPASASLPEPEPRPEAEAPLEQEAAAAPPEGVPADPEPIPPTPQRIQLAAGMAIEVDGSLDLRGHTAADALERVRERVLDGVCLGWRTLHILLGESEESRELLLAYLSAADPRVIPRYAQAPIPMGGAAAWVLYLGKP